jgi:hypothetical protein
MGLSTIAEGVEDAATDERLARIFHAPQIYIQNRMVF